MKSPKTKVKHIMAEIIQKPKLSFFFFLVALGFELKASHLQSSSIAASALTSSPFCSGYFGNGISRTGLGTVSLPSS
jgi:hypothetical protein